SSFSDENGSKVLITGQRRLRINEIENVSRDVPNELSKRKRNFKIGSEGIIRRNEVRIQHKGGMGG
ncbi:hypothetical protein Tco_1445804, partial [Tanacetum coccineum]